MPTTHNVQTFDPVAAVEEYRRVIERRDSPETPESGRDEFELMAKRLRACWTEWQGEDSLHEMAFGAPVE
jgi:hypothetical protein